ncbi:MAG TPA: uroporphyrinogen decarboxylase family protein [Candidatus Hydrogenedentes bacterium]|nr:uroporphyrinogen decarboxylase family protein [Candidatus Hydrogenedentota bacterium]HOL75428.1 uroporphyrinogen decarboxylase family protein [Candidatus Hydrogenedentota bacterium]HPO84937.1 uroporphyrinogen decarboxylase family protein [Candidatus Hydrogenedentota bacterium]
MSDTPAEKHFQHQLRSYIFPSAPATRAPCDGTESEMRVEFGFTPRWFHKHCGIDFGEKWHTDPEYRYATVICMRKELNRRFPQLRLGGPNPEEQPATIDGVFGALTVSMLFGVSAQFFPDNWPVARHEYLDDQAAARLGVPDLSSSPVFANIMDQIDWIEREFGRVTGYLNWQGVLNNAQRLRGEAIFLDIMTNPNLAHHVFEVVTLTMIEGMKLVYRRQAATGFIVRHASVSNCLVNMISGEQYREFIMPYDKRISDSFDYFGIHNCAWNVDPYIPYYASIRTLGYIDMGLDSDLARVKKFCPNTRRAVMYNPKDLTSKTVDEIQDDIFRIRKELSPCDIVMADIEYGTPDQRVLEFAEAAEIAIRTVTPEE